MPLSIEFLDPHCPLLPLVAERLLPGRVEGPVDLGRVMVVAPTRQSGRRLREFLAREVRRRGGTAVLSLRVAAPNIFLMPEEGESVAQGFDVMGVWMSVLSGVALETLPGLMPGREGRLGGTAALEFGRRVQQLREALVDGDLDVAGVAARHPEASEQGRWADLAGLEAAYRAGLAARGLVDPCDAKRARARDYAPPAGVERMVLAAVPDPSPLVQRCWERLAERMPVEVWVHAAAEEAELFDGWGRPLPVWGERAVGPAADPEGWIERLADPGAMARRVAELLGAGPQRPDLALGVLDAGLIPRLADALARVERTLYDPSPVRVDGEPPGRLLLDLAEAQSRGDSASLRTLWRNPDVLRALTEEPAGLLRRWDAYAAEQVPGSAASVDETLTDPVLRAAWERLKGWIGARTAGERLAVLEAVYGAVRLNPERAEERFLMRVADAVSGVLQEAAGREEAGEGPEAEVVMQVLRETAVDPLRVEGDVTAEGWLELSYHPAPALLLAGMQEGQVPGTRVADAFLPDGLRGALGLRSDRDWLARDAYLFHNLVRSREAGAVRVLCMKRDGAGGPVHPSRLLFQCGDAQMLARAGLLFSEPPAPEPTPHAAPGLRLDPWRGRGEAPTRVAVTGLRSYLQCPFRFYLRHVLKMRRVTDAVREPDAAAFGSLLHAVLQTGLTAEPAALEAVEARLGAELDRRVRGLYGTRYGMAVEVLVQNAHRRLRAAARLHHGLLEEGWRILLTEQEVEREMGGVTVVGKIDRVDVHPEKGLRILDYKTGDRPSDPEAAHLGTRRSGVEALWTVNAKGKAREWVDLQLPVYRWLAEGQPWAEPGVPLEVGYFQLPKAVNDTQIVGWPGERDQAASARAALEHVLGCIRAGIWWPPNEAVRHDDFEGLFVHGAAGFTGAEWGPRIDG